eukprot:6561375-Prymnesium_polylepis.1
MNRSSAKLPAVTCSCVPRQPSRCAHQRNATMPHCMVLGGRCGADRIGSVMRSAGCAQLGVRPVA